MASGSIKDEGLAWPPTSHLLRECRRLATTAALPVVRSHRPWVGPAVTTLKRLMLASLTPWRSNLLGSQFEFNQAAIESCEHLLEARPIAPGLAGLARLPKANPVARQLLRKQIQWNAILADVLQRVGTASDQEAAALHGQLVRAATSLAPGPFIEILRAQARWDELMGQLAYALLGLHSSLTFEYRGYRTPIHLLKLTGAGPESWQPIAELHLKSYSLHAPLRPDHHVLEIGCGVGRDAMHLLPLLSNGTYVGVDIIAPSIHWCQANIVPRHPSARFVHLDVKSELYNPEGSLDPAAAPLPVESESTDRILLQSVFTHLLPDAIRHYLREFRRVLKQDGLVYASAFVVDEDSRRLIGIKSPQLTFAHRHRSGAWIDSYDAPEEAVGLPIDLVRRMVAEAGLRTVAIVPGSWPGRPADGYQDALILGRA
jgi:SAM-dependent methyltransferase